MVQVSDPVGEHLLQILKMSDLLLKLLAAVWQVIHFQFVVDLIESEQVVMQALSASALKLISFFE